MLFNMENNIIYNLIIIGAGPAGLSASIYASGYKINHIVLAKDSGGMASTAHKIWNYPGMKDISGFELMQKFEEHAKGLGGKIIIDEVVDIIKKDNYFCLKTISKKDYCSQAILITSGTHHRKLGLENEEKFLGKGISYCATCDGMFYKNKNVAVFGGSDSAAMASLYLADIANKVFLIYRKEKLRAMPTWTEQLEKNNKVEIIYNTNIIGLEGKEDLEKIILDNDYKGAKQIIVEGLFIEIGLMPQAILFKNIGGKTDNNDKIIVDGSQKTNIKGIWAAGDITTGSNNFQQIITASSEGAVAVNDIFKFLKS